MHHAILKSNWHTRWLHWTICLPLCGLVVWGCLATPTMTADEIKSTQRDGVITVQWNGQPLLEYYTQPRPNRGYVAQWHSPDGVQILRDSPHDHVHHHALMYAIGIDGVDFWTEVPSENFGKQVSRACTHSGKTTDQRALVTIQQELDWVDTEQKVLAKEHRTIKAQMGVIPKASLLTWQFTMCPAKDKQTAELWGRHYFGLGMRFVESMDQDGRFVMPNEEAGVAVRGSEKLTRSDWCAYLAEVDGKPVTVAMFDDPENPRHPATWFTMTNPFAYLTATLNLKEKPMTIRHEQPLAARYGIVLWDGHTQVQEIQAAYETWLALK